MAMQVTLSLLFVDDVVVKVTLFSGAVVASSEMGASGPPRLIVGVGGGEGSLLVLGLAGEAIREGCLGIQLKGDMVFFRVVLQELAKRQSSNKREESGELIDTPSFLSLFNFKRAAISCQGLEFCIATGGQLYYTHGDDS